MRSAKFFRLAVFCGIAAAAIPAIAQEDCANWRAPIASYGLENVKLGMPLNAAWTSDKPTEFGSGLRFFDHQQINSSIGATYSIETVTCADGGEVIVGIVYGDYGPGPASVGEFIQTRTAELQREGVRRVLQHESNRDLYLWGIKTRVDGQSGAMSDYLILRRRCTREKAADGGEACSVSSQEIHLARSKIRMD